jgi:drug/metabolite transporter (DMT)-like permease
MQLWFWAALTAMILAGFSNFYFKQAAVRGYDPAHFSLLGSLWSLVFVSILLLFKPEPLLSAGIMLLIPLIVGIIATSTNIFKVKALQYIDATIYFPLFKLLTPTIAIAAGVVFFTERFTPLEWLGIGLGLSVHVLLVTRAEQTRQKHLLAGLGLVIVTAVTSAIGAVLTKFSIDIGMSTNVVLLFMSIGLCIGSVLTVIFKTGFSGLFGFIQFSTSANLVMSAGMRSILITGAAGLTTYAYALGGSLSMVQTILSFYVLITIVLSIIVYNEHWNAQKVFAILLSVAALAFFH